MPHIRHSRHVELTSWDYAIYGVLVGIVLAALIAGVEVFGPPILEMVTNLSALQN